MKETKKLTLDEFLKETHEGKKTPEEKPETQEPYDLPEGWKWVKIKDIAKTTAGGTPRRSIREYWENGTIPWVKSGELEDNIIYETEEKITEKALKNSNVKLFPKGTLLVAMYGATVGKTAILGIDAATNQAVCAIFPNENIVIRDYIRYYFIHKRRDLIRVSFGGAQPNISQIVIKDLDVPLPPLEEQRRIVSRLEQLVSRAEEAKRLKRMAKEEAEKIMQAVLNKVFSKAEEEWNKVEIGEIISLEKGRKPANLFKEKIEGSLPYLTAQFMRGLEEPRYCLRDDNTVIVEPLDVLIIMDGSYSGDVFTGFNGVLASTMAKLILNKKYEQKILPKYLYYFLKMNFEVLNTKTKGAAIPHVRKDVLFTLQIPLPHLEEQKKIVMQLDSIKENIESLRKLHQRTEEELEKIVPAILDRAFKGEL